MDGMDRYLVPESAAILSTIEGTYSLLHNYRRALDEHSIVATTDTRGRITYVNDKFCAISGYSQEELVGRTHKVINSGKHPPSFFMEMWRSIGKGMVWQGIMCNRAKEGSLYWVKTTIVPFRSPAGVIESYVAIRTDVSDQIKTMEKLESLKDELEKEQQALRNKNVALQELLSHLDQEKNKVLQLISTNLNISVFPELDRLIGKIPSHRNSLESIKASLGDVANPILRQAQLAAESLTHKELQICHLIRKGMTIKDISTHLNVSVRTVDKHRENIRKKLGITDRKVNLGSYLVRGLRDT